MAQRNRGRPAGKGSQKWIQILVNEKPHLLDHSITRELNLSKDDCINWLSPLRNEGYTEYFDEASLDILGVQLSRKPLRDFWPRNGPHWDALGKTAVSSKLLLVEAKSHIRELVTSVRANPASLRKIRERWWMRPNIFSTQVLLPTGHWDSTSM
jgi:hypothetical protein